MSVNIRPIGQRISSPIKSVPFLGLVHQKIRFKITQQISRMTPTTAGRCQTGWLLSTVLGVSEYTSPFNSASDLVRFVASEITRVSVKQAVNAKAASQKFWAISLGNTLRMPR